MSESGQAKIYQMVTDQVVEAIEKAIESGEQLPWQRPWSSYMPQNMINRKAYRGINVWLLGLLPYASPFFLSKKQVAKKNGTIKETETKNGHIIIFWTWLPVTDKVTGKEKTIPFLRYYKVWNLEQTEGIESPKIDTIDFKPIDVAEQIILDMPNQPPIDNGPKACYYPTWDKVEMPMREHFHGEAEYYSTLFHELVHSTGHSTRLSRDEVTNINMFGSHDYSQEELVAEMGATFLCATCGIKPTFDNSVAYLHGWLNKIKSDPKLIIKAGGKAQKATDYILNIQFDNNNKLTRNTKDETVKTVQTVQTEQLVLA